MKFIKLPKAKFSKCRMYLLFQPNPIECNMCESSFFAKATYLRKLAGWVIGDYGGVSRFTFSDFVVDDEYSNSLTIGFGRHGKKATAEQKATLNTRMELGRITNNRPQASGHMLQSFNMIDSSHPH